jgi:hypothetical protein
MIKSRPSATVTSWMNTSGGRPIATSENSPKGSLPTPLKINYTNNVPGRGSRSSASPCC